MSWTDERIDRLKEMWSRGMTASQIAEELGAVSRNAVIGKAHRLGLQSRPSPVKPNELPVADAASAPAPAPAAAPEPAAKAAQEPVDVLATTTLDVPGEPPFDLEDEDEDEPEAAPAAKATPSAPKSSTPLARSIGPGGFERQMPGEQQAPIPPAPPRRLVPAKPSPEIADKTSLLDLNERICKWPIGHPGEPDFHFCGKQSNPGFPYCVEHCGVAYQAQLPRRDRKPPPPLPFGGPRVR